VAPDASSEALVDKDDDDEARAATMGAGGARKQGAIPRRAHPRAPAHADRGVDREIIAAQDTTDVAGTDEDAATADRTVGRRRRFIDA
jgi:hypothetical protein